MIAERAGEAFEGLVLGGDDGEGPYDLGKRRCPEGMLGIGAACGEAEEVVCGNDAGDVGPVRDGDGGEAASAQEANRPGCGVLGGQGGRVFEYVV